MRRAVPALLSRCLVLRFPPFVCTHLRFPFRCALTLTFVRFPCAVIDRQVPVRRAAGAGGGRRGPHRSRGGAGADARARGGPHSGARLCFLPCCLLRLCSFLRWAARAELWCVAPCAAVHVDGVVSPLASLIAYPSCSALAWFLSLLRGLFSSAVSFPLRSARRCCSARW